MYDLHREREVETTGVGLGSVIVKDGRGDGVGGSTGTSVRVERGMLGKTCDLNSLERLCLVQ